MNDKKDFEAALKGKKVPLLVLDQKWHRLFAIHGKTDEISATEKELDELLKLQGKYNNELKNLKSLSRKLCLILLPTWEMTAMKIVTRISSL